MGWSGKRSRDFRNEKEFTAEEMEAADALLSLSYFGGFFVHWAVKRRRSAIARGGFSDTHQSKLINGSPLTPLGQSWSESDDSEERIDCLQAPSMDACARNLPRRRLPKKKTPKELKEMVNTLSLERGRLKKEVEQLLKTYQDLQDRNSHLKSQLASCLDQRQEQKLLSTPQPTSSDRDSSHGTETFVSVSDSLRLNEHDCSDNFVSTFALDPVCDGPRCAGVPMYPYFLESSSGSEKGDSCGPVKDPSCFLGLPDLNAPFEAMCDIVPNGFHGEMLLSRSKAAVAAEARRRRIELTRVKYGQTRIVRAK
ncbi:hypothetical protein KI387_035469 [Taxus chinensis]|uniref:BZIP domain-containing protein n=1 Tax=Taxus chinensis TaxID=29808 RepID=A0AA38FR28_TAXCH|nr:hypothetical protein KI387_035469 [Taxus chinensis]